MNSIRKTNRVTDKPRKIRAADGTTGYRSAAAARAATGTVRYDRDTRRDMTTGKAA